MADQVGDIIKNITDDVKVVVRGEMELAKMELAQSAKRAGKGGGMLGVGAVFGATALVLLIWAGSFGFALMWRAIFDWSDLLSVCLGFVTMAILALLIAAPLVLAGKAQIGKVEPPKKAIAQASATASAAGQAIQTGNAQVEAEVAARQAGRQLTR